MKASAVYRKAAEFVDRTSSVCCHALDRVSRQGWMRGTAYEDFRELFCDGSEYAPGGWFGFHMDASNKQRRVLALLFMAEIARDEE
jgi:hypothetical protein